MSTYKSTSTGAKLERRPNMFYYRGEYFPGLVDIHANTLHDDPENSFADAVSIPSSIAQGLIELMPNDPVQPPARKETE